MRSFTFTISGDLSDWLKKLEDGAKSTGVKFEGDVQSGSFAKSGVEGTYKTEGDKAEITIHRKPAFIPWATVESALKEIFE